MVLVSRIRMGMVEDYEQCCRGRCARYRLSGEIVLSWSLGSGEEFTLDCMTLMYGADSRF